MPERKKWESIPKHWKLIGLLAIAAIMVGATWYGTENHDPVLGLGPLLLVIIAVGISLPKTPSSS